MAVTMKIETKNKIEFKTFNNLSEAFAVYKIEHATDKLFCRDYKWTSLRKEEETTKRNKPQRPHARTALEWEELRCPNISDEWDDIQQQEEIEWFDKILL